MKRRKLISQYGYEKECDGPYLFQVSVSCLLEAR